MVSSSFIFKIVRHDHLLGFYICVTTCCRVKLRTCCVRLTIIVQLPLIMDESSEKRKVKVTSMENKIEIINQFKNGVKISKICSLISKYIKYHSYRWKSPLHFLCNAFFLVWLAWNGNQISKYVTKKYYFYYYSHIIYISESVGSSLISLDNFSNLRPFLVSKKFGSFKKIIIKWWSRLLFNSTCKY